jgi:hypothetical protein
MKQEVSNSEMQKDCGPSILGFWSSGFQDFWVYKLLIHKKNEIRSVELRNEKRLWVQHFGISGFQDFGVQDSRFQDFRV